MTPEVQEAIQELMDKLFNGQITTAEYIAAMDALIRGSEQ